ncbi:unnamed protein product [Didymodactylos carnosus]|uniref:Uncharacterized protein n=1 Tax=Didymodactylos carnosus TaxID=1234261 RepID=A0A8S2QK20_9BILA|nr:unnamed protein product [Didymodactylos carnosus]CAF4097718.1 unnamed protein product [Didymodactylos carnosus]
MSSFHQTHVQLDQQVKLRQEQISIETKKVIEYIEESVLLKQQTLLDEINKEQKTQEEDYRSKLQLFIEKLDKEKAATLAELKSSFHKRNEFILSESRLKIEKLNQQAYQAKINVMIAEQQSAMTKIDLIKKQVQIISDDVAQRHFASKTTTTVIVTSDGCNPVETINP